MRSTFTYNIAINKGLRDKGALEATLNRPYQTFDNKDLYVTAIDKCAALFESLIINHPFIDGNKRIAYVLMRLVLLKYQIDIVATEDEKYEFVIKAATGDIKYDGIKKWIEEHSFTLQ